MVGGGRAWNSNTHLWLDNPLNFKGCMVQVFYIRTQFNSRHGPHDSQEVVWRGPECDPPRDLGPEVARPSRGLGEGIVADL